ncbi:MAG: DUF3488 domain-containing transglutaminase family protein [Xylophilus sp.]|nr:DUF3488 domain-containing transglutaminase family protein [Burkholderiaceae bacterium]MBP6651773.1 DUF3488 domain-containing transglutaminase family protein [Xylophilus sp.]
MVNATSTTSASAPTGALPGLRQKLGALPRDSRDTLFLLAVVGWILLPQVNALPVWASVLAYGVLLWRGWLAWHARPLPGRWWLLAALAVAVAGTLFTHKTILGRDAGLTLVTMLLALKTLELRARRDAFVVFFLGFFAMLGNFFFSQSLLTAGAMVIGLLGLLTALVNAHMPVGKPPLSESARMAGKMVLLGAPIMAALFVLFPRMGPLWGAPNDTSTGRSGLSPTMQIGNIAKLALDDSIALRVRFDLPGGGAPPSWQLYFRGPVLGSFDGREWRSLSAPPDGMQRVQPPADLVVSGPGIRYEVTMEPNQYPWVLAMDAAQEAPDLPGRRVRMAPDLQWFTNRPISELVRYQATSYADFRHGPLQMTPQLRVFTELPAGYNPRTLQLAADMRRDPALAQADTATLVDAAMEKLRTGGFSYTLEPGVYGQHAADEFWFDRKEGFCEHIASSFVVLMRALDIPSRIVTGYQGGDLNSVDGFWTLRQSDAHAWAEVWQAGKGWVRVDPTAAVAPGRIGVAGRLQAPRGVVGNAFATMVSPTVLASIRAGWEALNNGWNQWVLNYAQTSQINLLKKIGFTAPSWEDLLRVLAGLVAGVALVAVVWARWERSRRDPWLQLLDQARQRLQAAGLPLGPAVPARSMAQQARQHFGDAAAPASHWLLQLEMLRYAPGGENSAHTSRTLATLRREFHQLSWPPAI